MKLLYITASFPFGKGESFLFPEIKALKKEGVELIIVPIFPRGEMSDDWKSIQHEFKLYNVGLISIDILLHFFKYSIIHFYTLFRHLKLLKGSNINQLVRNLAVLPKSLWLKKILYNENPDHIHAHWGSTTSTAAMLTTHLTNYQWSLTCHRWDIYENNLLSKKSFYSKFIRFISQKGYQDALSFGVLPHKSVVVHMGTTVPQNPVYPIWKNVGDLFTIICPANLIPVKGHIYLIEAVSDLIHKNYNIKLLIAGDGLLKNELKSLVLKRGIENNVTFMGQLPHNNLMKLYTNSLVHLMVLPSVDLGNGEHEGVPVSLMEAMSYGVPVLSTRTGSINELLPIEADLTVMDKNPEQLSQRIEYLYSNPDEYRKVSFFCRNIIEKDWDIELSAKKLVSSFFID